MSSSRTWTRLALVAAALFAVLALAPAARAQTITLNPGGITRTVSHGSSTAINQYWISQPDCLQDDVMSFPLTINQLGYEIQVWVGGAGNDCTQAEQRSGQAPTCWLVWSGTPANNAPIVDVRVQDIIGQHKPTSGSTGSTAYGPGSGTVADCSGANQGSPDPQQITLFFMFINSGNVYTGTGYQWQTKFDLVGPNAPAGVGVGIGDTFLVLDWSASVGQTDLAGYNFYCEIASADAGAGTPSGPLDAASDAATTPDANGCPPGQVPIPDAGVADAAADDADADAGADGGEDAAIVDAAVSDVEVADGCMLAPPEEDAGGDAGPRTTGDDAGSDAATYTGTCPAVSLVPGQVPGANLWNCAQLPSATATEGRVEDLANGTVVSVAVAAVDVVGNVGPLSNVVCEAPQPVDDFYKLYRDAGGKAGGGYCTVNGAVGRAAGGAGVLAAVAGVALALARRARRSAR